MFLKQKRICVINCLGFADKWNQCLSPEKKLCINGSHRARTRSCVLEGPDTAILDISSAFVQATKHVKLEGALEELLV